MILPQRSNPDRHECHLKFFDSRSNCRVIIEDGFAGVEAVHEHCPDVVIMDVGMPHMDGIAATQAIKQQQPTVKVVMLTSHTDQTEVIAVLSSGQKATV